MQENIFDFSPLSVSTSILRSFAQAGEVLINPEVAFAREKALSLASDGTYGSTYLGSLDEDDLRFEQRYVEMAALLFETPSTGEGFLKDEPENVLINLLRRERYMRLTPKRLAAKDWDYHRISFALVAASYYLEKHSGCRRVPGWRRPVRIIEGAPQYVLCTWKRLFAHQENVANPLVIIRRFDDVQRKAFEDAWTRRHALGGLEELSTQIWHMSTSIDSNLLLARLLLQADAGERGISLLSSCINLYESNYDVEFDGQILTSDAAGLQTGIDAVASDTAFPGKGSAA